MEKDRHVIHMKLLRITAGYQLTQERLKSQMGSLQVAPKVGGYYKGFTQLNLHIFVHI